MTSVPTTRLRGILLFTVLFLALMGMGTATAALAQPSFSKSFSPSTIGPGSVSTLTFSIVNSGSSGVRGLSFADNLPAGMTLADPARAESSCGGALSAADGGTAISLTGGSVGASSSCSITVDVTAASPGNYDNVSEDLTSDAGNSGSASATLTVDASRPGFSKSFLPAAVNFGGRSTLTFTIDNSASSSDVFFLTFTDPLPAGMTVANPANASTTCAGGTLGASPGGSVISLTTVFSGSPAVSAGASCTVTVDVIGGAVGELDNVSGELTASGIGPALSSGKASATLTVTVERLGLTKEFVGDPVLPGDNVTLEFTVTNFERSSTASSIAFTDDLGATLSGLTAVNTPISNPCGAGSTLSGTNFLTFSGGTLAAGDSCTISVILQVPAAAASGSYPNTTSAVSASVGGRPVTGNAAGDVLFVSAAPALEKSFLPAAVGAGGTTSMEFTLTNPGSSAASDISFTDDLQAFISGLTVSALPASGFCGAGSTATVVSLSGSPTLIVAGASLAAGDSCSFSVDLELPLAVQAGSYVNVTGQVTAIVNGAEMTGNGASASLDVVAAPALTKEFIDDPVLAGDSVTLRFRLIYGEENTQSATDVAFTDDLAAVISGLEAVGLPLTDPCGAGSELSGTSLLSFTGGSLAPGETCEIDVTLQVPPGALPGDYPNATSNVMASVGGVDVVGPAAIDDLSIAGLSFSKEFTDDPVLPGATVNLELTLENTSTFDATDIFFTDNLDAALSGLAVSGALPAEPCGSGSSISGTGNLIFTGGNLLSGESCVISLTLQVPASAADGTYVNSTSSLVATVGGNALSLDPAVDALEVSSDVLLFSKEFVDDPVAPGDTVTLEFTLDNLSDDPITGLAFTDDLDAALAGLVSTSGTQTGICGGGSQLSGTSVLAFTGGSLAGGASCAFSVTLAVPSDVALGSVVTNETSELTGSLGSLAVSGDPARDTLQIDFLELTKVFDGPAFAGGTSTLTFAIRNLSSTTAVNDLAFSDDLDAVLSGLAATVLPGADPCGTGSSLSGSSFLILSGGRLLPGGSCTFSVELAVPESAEPGSYLNVTSNLRQGTTDAARPASATLVIEDAPDLPPTVDAPTVAPEPSDEGQAAIASAAFSDPAGAADAPFTCTVDYGDGSGPQAGTVSGFVCTGPAHPYGDNGTYTVTVTVTDRGGLSGSASAPHEVLNVAPTVAAPVVAPEPSNEGDAVMASAAFSDPGADDSPFACTVDYGDGSGPQAGTVTGSVCDGPAHVYADNGTYTVTVAVSDKDGGTGSASALHQVDNVAPTLTGASNSAEQCGTTAEGGLVEVSVDFSDPGFDSVVSGTFEDFTDSTIDWGDGSVDPADVDEVPGGPGTPTTGTVSGDHVYATGGIYTVTVTVTDDDGGSDSVELTAFVTGVGLNDGSLQVVGTVGRDVVQVQSKRRGAEIDVKTNFAATATFATADVEMLEVSTCADRDLIQVHRDVTVPAILDGGRGPDKIHAGDGVTLLLGGHGNDGLYAGDNDGDVLEGGIGDDFLSGGKGNDVLRGGLDSDRLFGRQGDDALDGGPGVDQCNGGPGTDTEVNCE